MIFLVRHGQTEFNAERPRAGRARLALTPPGIEQGKRLGRMFAGLSDTGPAASSPARSAAPSTRRASSASMPASPCDIATDARLAEISLGKCRTACSGPTSNTPSPISTRAAAASLGTSTPPAAEHGYILSARLQSWLDDARKLEGPIAVSHGVSSRTPARPVPRPLRRRHPQAGRPPGRLLRPHDSTSNGSPRRSRVEARSSPSNSRHAVLPRKGKTDGGSVRAQPRNFPCRKILHFLSANPRRALIRKAISKPQRVTIRTIFTASPKGRPANPSP